jgi:hypothetical protein
MPPKFEPTDEQRKLVKMMSGFGIPQNDIALHLEIDPTTLRKHFRRELDRGMIEANVKVAQSLFQMATTGKNVAAAIFWMKARAQWREKHEVTLSANTSLEELSDAELNRMIHELRDKVAIEEQTIEATRDE